MMNPVDDFAKDFTDSMEMLAKMDITTFPLDDQIKVILAFKELTDKIKLIYVKNLVRNM